MLSKSLMRPAVCSLDSFANIAQALSAVEQLRLERSTRNELAQRTRSLRLFQAERFRSTYADIVEDAHMGPAALFFLSELYSGQEYSRRDAQFARIAAAIERIFPRSVVQTATLLAKLHALSETLDMCMAVEWQSSFQEKNLVDLPLYQHIWGNLLITPGYAAARQQQLEATEQLAIQLQRHTKVPGLRLMLKMMNVPAAAAGLQELQLFLERGFDTFGRLDSSGKLPLFLDTIKRREIAWLVQMAT